MLQREAGGSTREDLLVMFGQSSAESGHFGQAAAACAAFLGEFGTDYVLSKRVVSLLAGSLAPLDLNQVSIGHGEDGPRFMPSWRMAKDARPELVEAAVFAYGLLAEISHDEDSKGNALLKLGWVHRALNEWEAATQAWLRCAHEAKGSKHAATALWLAAEDLAWTEKPGSAAQLLRRLVEDYPNDFRRAGAIERAGILEAEAARDDSWFVDPVASLRAEIAARQDAKRPYQVYSTSVKWLQRRRQTGALIAISRWACTQTDWPLKARAQAHLDLAAVLVSGSHCDDATRLEAATVLRDLAEIAPTPSWSVNAALRSARLWSELGRFAEADDVLARFAERRADIDPWRPLIKLERIRTLVDRQDLEGARRVRGEFKEAFPEWEIPAGVAQALAGNASGGG